MRRRDVFLSTTMLSGVVGGFLLLASAANAADLSLLTKAPAPMPGPAVDAFNTKIEGFGGALSGKSIYGGTGSMTFPLANQYGAQIDGATGSLDGSTFGAVAGHLFWREPSRALFGIYGSFTEWDRFGGAQVGQIAAEGEYFYGRWTLQGIMGVEFGNTVSSTQFASFTVPPAGGLAGTNTATVFGQGFSIGTRYFDQINLKYYLTDNSSAYVGHRYLGGKNMAAFGGELALPVARGVLASAFVEGRVGEDSTYGVWGGLKFYFGPNDKPLIARHRQEDPNNWTVDTLFSILNSSTSSSTSSTQQFCSGGITPINGSCETF
jgi:hypothetical protein